MNELLITAGLSVAGRSLINDEDIGAAVLKHAANNFLDAPADKILTNTTLLDYFGLLCLSAKFAETIEECWFVAVLLTKGVKNTKSLPTVLMEDRDGTIRVFYKHGLDVPARILTALTVFPEAVEARTRRYGAPAPDFYRKLSKAELRAQKQPAVAAHHEAWEDHLGPFLHN